VAAILKRNNVAVRGRSLTEPEVQLAIKLYASGLSLAVVGSRFGKTAGTIQRALMARGIPTRDSHGRPRLG
jgi:hypothetical protein